MVAKLSAASLIVLCILPFTAPFSTLDAAHSLSGRNADAVIGTLATQTSATDDDVSPSSFERSDFLKQSRLCALVVDASCDAPPILALFLRSVPPTTFDMDSPPLKTILRL